MTQPVACTVAGSDSGGGAGIQADLKTFAACGVYGASVIVALTAQDTVAVHAVAEVSAAMVAAWKTGMLGSAATIATVVERLRHHRIERLVVDPVMVAKSGDRLLAEDAVAALRDELLPLALVLTPNLSEAEVLLDRRIDGVAAMRDATEALCRLGPTVAVLKGGHVPGDRVVDVIADSRSGRCVELVNERVPGTSTHGTGCTLSSAIAAFLARGVDTVDAVASARAYLQEALRRAPGLGAGHGPLGHFDVAIAAPVVRAAARV